MTASLFSPLPQLAPKKATEPKQKTEKTDPDVGKKATKAGPKKANGAEKGSGMLAYIV